jgi:hypothetical protein
MLHSTRDIEIMEMRPWFSPSAKQPSSQWGTMISFEGETLLMAGFAY